MTNYSKVKYLPSVRLGQLRDLTRLLNRKSPWTIAALKILEAVDGDTRCTSSELEQTRLLLSIPTPDTLQLRFSFLFRHTQTGDPSYLPEVLNDLIALGVATVIGVLLPIIHIDICNSSNEQLQLALIEDCNQIRWDQLVESSDEGIELLLHALLDTPFRNESGRVSLGPDIPCINSTYSTYSLLFSFVTSMSCPPGFRSIVTVSPNRSSSVEKVRSSTPSMSLSLESRQQCKPTIAE